MDCIFHVLHHADDYDICDACAKRFNFSIVNKQKITDEEFTAIDDAKKNNTASDAIAANKTLRSLVVCKNIQAMQAKEKVFLFYFSKFIFLKRSKFKQKKATSLPASYLNLYEKMVSNAQAYGLIVRLTLI